MKNRIANVNWIETAERLRKLRQDNGYTQEELAEILEMSSSTYKKIEGAACGLTVERLTILKEKLGVSADRILYGEKTGLDDLWDAVMNLGSEDRFRLFLRLCAYYYQVGDYEYPDARSNKEWNERIEAVLKSATREEE